MRSRPTRCCEAGGRATRLAAAQARCHYRARSGVGARDRSGDPGLLKSTLAWSADAASVYFAGAREDDASQADIYTVSDTSAPAAITGGDGAKVQPLVDPSGRFLVFTVSGTSPFRQPGQAGGPGGRPAQTQFGIVNLRTHETTTMTGSSVTMSPDGSTIAYLTSGRENAVVVMPLAGAPVVVTITTGRLAAPALSPMARASRSR